MIDAKPCFYIRPWLPLVKDQALTGALGSYVRWHVGHCPKCTAALANLHEIASRLSHERAQTSTLAMSDERWARLEQAWDAVEVGASSDHSAGGGM